MARTTLNDIKARRLDQMSAVEHAEFDVSYAETKLALKVGDEVSNAREATGHQFDSDLGL